MDPRKKESAAAPPPTVSVSVSHSVSESSSTNNEQDKMTTKTKKTQSSVHQLGLGKLPQKQDGVEMKKKEETNKAQAPFRIRGRLPPRKQEVREKSENPSNDRKPFEHGKIRGRILPKTDQKKTPVLQEEPATKKSFGFDPSRLRSRLSPKIDPRGKQAEDSKSPAVSVSVR